MSVGAQEAVERAGVRLREAAGRMGSVRRGGVIEKVANVFCGTSNNAANVIANRNNKSDKNGPPDKTSTGRFLLGKVKTSNGITGQNNTTPPHNSPRPARKAIPKIHRKPLLWEEMIKDESFLSRVFMYLSCNERAVAAQVCLRWRTVLYNPSYWRNTRAVLNCKEVRADTEEQTAEMRRKFYVSVQMRGFDAIVLVCATDADLMDLVANYSQNHCRILRCVGLRCCSVSDKGLEALLEHLGGVYQLELQSCNELTEAGLWAVLRPRIVSLTIADCINVADEAIGAMAQMLPSLYELSLQAYHVTDAALALFSPRQTACLSILRLHSCWELTNQAVLNIVHALPNLTVLSLSGCSKITDEGVEVLAENLRKLRALDLSWCPRITDAALEYIACDLTNLEELTLDRCVHITDIGVGYISTMLSLTALYLRWCTQVRDFGIQHLSSMRGLLVLSLAGCSQVSSNGLSSLIQLNQLQELELTNCPGATTELHQHLLLHLPKCLVIE